jgi:hypothetical protein
MHRSFRQRPLADILHRSCRQGPPAGILHIKKKLVLQITFFYAKKIFSHAKCFFSVRQNPTFRIFSPTICNLVRQTEIFSPTKYIFSPTKCNLVRKSEI